MVDEPSEGEAGAALDPPLPRRAMESEGRADVADDVPGEGPPRDGVGKNEIAIKAFGDTVLLVPTGPGVREPQNRRVEIIIR